MKALKPKQIHLTLMGWLLFVGISDAAEAEKLQVPTQVWQCVTFEWEDAEADPRQTPQHSSPSPTLGSGRSEMQLPRCWLGAGSRLIDTVQAEKGTWGWLLFGKKLIKKPLDLQLWCNSLLPFQCSSPSVSRVSAGFSAVLRCLLCLTNNMPVNSLCSQGASSCHSRQKIKKIPGKAEPTCLTGKGDVTKGNRIRGAAGVRPGLWLYIPPH